MLVPRGFPPLGNTKLRDQPIKRLELVGGDGMKKKRIKRKEKRQSKGIKALAPSWAAAKVSGGPPVSACDFKPIEIRGEPLSATVLRERR
jgi:hypothetical protein